MPTDQRLIPSYNSVIEHLSNICSAAAQPWHSFVGAAGQYSDEGSSNFRAIGNSQFIALWPVTIWRLRQRAASGEDEVLELSIYSCSLFGTSMQRRIQAVFVFVWWRKKDKEQVETKKDQTAD